MIQIQIMREKKTTMKNLERNENTGNTVLGWCSYCKDTVHLEDDYVKKDGQLYHVDCWKQKNGFVEELEFDQ